MLRRLNGTAHDPSGDDPMHAILEQDRQAAELNERLRMEPGWNEAASGLTWILIGYLVFVVGTAVGIGMVIWSARGWLFGTGAQVGRLPGIGTIWIFYIGLGILSVVGTFGYLITLGGHWQCMHGSAERHGARWLMFFCVTALFAGPALNVASYIGCCQRGPDLSRGARSLQELQFTRTGQHMQLAGAGASLLYSVLFLLYLRAVAKCHGSTRHALLVNFYLLLASVLVAASVYVGYLGYKDPHRDLATWRMWLLGSWGATVIFYLFLIAGVRMCVSRSLARVKSPLDM
ncbi:MAG: hypothetical protein IT429_08015 [Gemmataceae bacterium]|nr:hypothetical protein [Gemmataceae bacterium]